MASLRTFKEGERVMVCARDAFYAFVDGWQGIVTGVNNGAVQVTCERYDGQKILFVPAEQLVMTVLH